MSKKTKKPSPRGINHIRAMKPLYLDAKKDDGGWQSEFQAEVEKEVLKNNELRAEIALDAIHSLAEKVWNEVEPGETREGDQLTLAGLNLENTIRIRDKSKPGGWATKAIKHASISDGLANAGEHLKGAAKYAHKADQRMEAMLTALDRAGGDATALIVDYSDDIETDAKAG